ncbi:MAG: ATP-binding cassette domain-containing protein, partial [Bosea sp.]|nr:ATP-binding cassette domain-containing protein [Bosea sp. (in: a-proteobacteria)]
MTASIGSRAGRWATAALLGAAALLAPSLATAAAADVAAGDSVWIGSKVGYGGIQAVRGITFHVEAGETVALIGANGAGKTSTLKALARLLDAAGGSVRCGGREISALPPHELIAQGIALVPEGRGVFPRMTIVENLLMGAYRRHDAAAVKADIAR